MNKTFLKIKSGHIIRTLIKSIVFGVAAGLLVVGAVLLALKLSAIDLAVWYYILMGAGVALITCAIVFAVIRPNDKKVAKAVDEEYKLQEKVQTALEFENEQGTIIRMQREDANERIKSLPHHKPNLKKLWVFPIAVVLSVGMALAGILVPLKQVEAEDDPYDRPPTRYEILALQELIENVRSSHLIQPNKADTIGQLQGILDELEEYDNVSDVMPTIETAIAQISISFENVKEFDKLSQSLREQRLTELSTAAGSAILYEDYRFVSYDLVESFDGSLLELINAAVEPSVNAFRGTYAGIDGSQISTKIIEMSQILTVALEVVDQEGSLYKSLEKFRTDMMALRDNITGGAAEETRLQHNIDLIFYDFEDNFIDALAEQSYTQTMGIFVVNRVKTIFGIPIEDNRPNEDAENKDDTPANPDSGGDHTGGYGDKDVIYGSDDMIYDPNTGKYVTYGELLNQYFAIVQEYLNQDSLTEDQKEIAGYYFEILFSGIKEDKN